MPQLVLSGEYLSARWLSVINKQWLVDEDEKLMRIDWENLGWSITFPITTSCRGRICSSRTWNVINGSRTKSGSPTKRRVRRSRWIFCRWRSSYPLITTSSPKNTDAAPLARGLWSRAADRKDREYSSSPKYRFLLDSARWWIESIISLEGTWRVLDLLPSRSWSYHYKLQSIGIDYSVFDWIVVSYQEVVERR